MGQPLEKYAGDKTKFEFKVHKQKRSMACGPACLRMLEQWATMKKPRSEPKWCAISRWNAAKGLSPSKMNVALGSIPAITRTRLAVDQVESWRQDPMKPPPVESDSVYLLHADWYGYSRKNYGHWIILLDIFRSAKGRPLALCAHPLQDAVEVWSWGSLLALEVVGAFHITRVSPAGE